MEWVVTNLMRDILVSLIDQSMDLLERSQQLSGLETALVEANAGSGRIALISGEAGIGKTSLVRRFASRQRARIMGNMRPPVYTQPARTSPGHAAKHGRQSWPTPGSGRAPLRSF
jgi:hypothetical protein